MSKISFLLLFFVANYGLMAQEKVWQNNRKVQKKIIGQDSIIIDSLVIIPNKFKILHKGKIVTPNQYRVDYLQGILYLQKSLYTQELQLEYYTFPTQERELFAKDSSIIQPYYSSEDKYTIVPKENKLKFFDGLQSRGSLVRGLTFGNNQGAAVQSSLDLQLNGKLSDEIYINAAIADNNVPIEADGYTQQLQEFDKVYIELYNQNSRIRAGQVDLLQQNDFFGNFAEKVTGLQVQTQLEGESATTNIAAAGSVSRGDFVSYRFTGIEGNQGPYRLEGNNGERFVVVVSGSERVYIDGIPLQRGADQDYVINYNTGEITFTTNRLITGNQRVLVEYIYADRNFSRFLFYGGVEHKRKKWNIATHFYSNGDSRNSPLSAELNDAQREVLANAGNDTSQMIIETAEQAVFDTNRNQYKIISIGGNAVFEYTTDSNETVYNVNFRFVGDGNGNYNPSNLDVNGRVYEYILPIAGEMQGSYSPTRQLVAPKRHQIYTLNANYKPNEKSNLGVDFALSNEDLNLFSSIDDNQNTGPAARLYAQTLWKSKNWSWSPRLEYSYLNKNFKAIQRLRSEEFARDFNLNQEIDSVNQHYLQAGIQGNYKKNLTWNYGMDYIDNESLYNGFRNKFNAQYADSSWIARAQASLLATSAVNENSRFFRNNFTVGKKLNKVFRLGAKWENEDNRIALTDGTDKEESFAWNQLSINTFIGDSINRYIGLELYSRRDDSVRLGSLTNISKALGGIVHSQLLKTQNQQLILNGHIRQINYGFSQQDSEMLISGNLRYSKSFWNRALRLNAFYELNSGREAQREFEYVAVQDGLGIYKWTDYNNDGIEQLDEFEIAEFQDQASYVRVFTSTINFLRTQKNQFNFSLQFSPKALSKSAFIKRLQFNTSINMGSSLINTQTPNWNPLVQTDEYFARNRNIRLQAKYLANEGIGWSGQYTHQNQTNAYTVFTGLEERKSSRNLLQLVYRPKNEMSFLANAEQSLTESNSAEFTARRFAFNAFKIRPEFQYKLGDTFNTMLFYGFENKNSLQSNEQLQQHESGMELQWNDKKKSSLAAQFSYVKNNFTGNENSIVGNQMMEGLRSGNNLVWQLQLQRQLSNALQLNVAYNGRKLEEGNTIHSGNVQLQIRF